MHYVDDLNVKYGGEGTKLYSTTNTHIKKLCLQNGLHLLDASVRHLGTDINYIVLQNMYKELSSKADFYFDTYVESVQKTEEGYVVSTADKNYSCSKCIVSAGRSGSKWAEKLCRIFITVSVYRYNTVRVLINHNAMHWKRENVRSMEIRLNHVLIARAVRL